MSLFEEPLGGFRFLVVLDPAVAYLPPVQALQVPVVAVGAFQECRGLSGDLEVMPYAEGGRNDFVHQLPVRHTWGRISQASVFRTLGLAFAWTGAATVPVLLEDII